MAPQPTAARIVLACLYHRKPPSVCSGGFLGSQGGDASGARRVAGTSRFRSADSHCGAHRTGRPNICRCNSSPHATSVRPTRRADMRARPLICHRHTAGRKPHVPIFPAGGGGGEGDAPPAPGSKLRPVAAPPRQHPPPPGRPRPPPTLRAGRRGGGASRPPPPPTFLPAGTKNTRDTCRAAIRAMHQ